jgi:hypothetical protein
MVEGVKTKSVLPLQLIALSRLQAGVLTRHQVAAGGLSDDVVRRLIADGIWRPVSRGVYALEPDSFVQRAWAGVLIGGPGAVLGRQAAAHLHRVAPTPPQRLTVYVGRATAPQRPDGPWDFVRARRTGRGEPPRTDLVTTLIDLAGAVTRDELVAILARAVTTYRVDPAQIVAAVEVRPGAHGRRQLLELLGGGLAGIDSPLEDRYDRQVAVPHGLPPARRQASVTRCYRCDLLYELYRLIVELDGLAYHLDKVADMERDNHHLMAGYRTLRFGWAHVTRDP